MSEENNESPNNRAWAGPIEIDYWNVDQDNCQDKLAYLKDHTKEELVEAIVSYQYDKFCRDHADAEDHGSGVNDTGKKIPYIGWFWRSIDFLGDVPIGFMRPQHKGTVSMVGFMANNKWDYPERYLTDGERLRVISYLDRAIACRRGSHIDKEEALKELWDYMQTLTIP